MMSRELNEKWTISKNYEYFNEYECFETRNEAIEFGKTFYAGDYFYIGQIKSVEICACLLAENCIEQIAESHFDNDGEIAEDYLSKVKNEHIEELDKAIEKIVKDWADKDKYNPEYLLVENVEYIEESEGI